MGEVEGLAMEVLGAGVLTQELGAGGWPNADLRGSGGGTSVFGRGGGDGEWSHLKTWVPFVAIELVTQSSCRAERRAGSDAAELLAAEDGVGGGAGGAGGEGSRAKGVAAAGGG